MGFELDDVHIEGFFIVSKSAMTQKKDKGGLREGGDERRRRGGGGDALGLDTTFLWSRVLTHSLRCNRTHQRVIRGRDVAGVMP